MKKGISLVVLVITMVILIILVGIIILDSNYILVDTNKSQLQTDISQLEYLMNIYKIRKNGNINFQVVQFDTTGLSSVELQQFNGETITNNKINLYVIDLEEIDAESVNYGNLELGQTDRYIYSNVTGKVYYEYGLEIDDVTYYYVEDGE